MSMVEPGFRYHRGIFPQGNRRDSGDEDWPRACDQHRSKNAGDAIRNVMVAAIRDGKIYRDEDRRGVQEPASA